MNSSFNIFDSIENIQTFGTNFFFSLFLSIETLEMTDYYCSDGDMDRLLLFLNI